MGNIFPLALSAIASLIELPDRVSPENVNNYLMNRFTSKQRYAMFQGTVFCVRSEP